MANKKAFKAESKRLMDLMIHSIYTHKEIFLRELISNASDAMDKLYYQSLTQDGVVINRDDLKIDLTIDREARTLTISDSGIGMTQDELENNLGVIAKSGSFQFKEDVEANEEIDIIGQFGVGFYSAFMVCDKVEVKTKKYGSEQAYLWVSENSDGYIIEETHMEKFGTEIKLFFKENSEDEDYDQYLDSFTIENLIKKYSDYVRYPINMDVEKSVKKDDSEEYETIIENKTLNSMIPLWKRDKKDISEEEYSQFYKTKFQDFTDPLKVIHTNVEGNISFNALLFIPSHAPHNYYSADYEKGLQLYSSGVFIMDKAAELIPEHFRFIKGLVDSQDLSLNISREILQHDRQLKVIANKIEKKIKSELLSMLKTDRDKYEQFFKSFGLQLKYGVYQDFGAHKEMLQDLLMFYSSKEKKLVTLNEYVNRMQEDQNEMFFMSGDSIDKIDKLPQVEILKTKDYEVLYLVDDVDEFALQMLNTYQEKTFKNASQGNLDLATDEQKAEIEKKTEENEDMLTILKEALSDEVSEVKISNRLVSHPVCLSAAEGISFEMEKVLSQMPDANPMGMKAQRILEINPNHEIFKALQKVYEDDKNSLKEYAEILYDQALLMEGFEIKDPMAFTDKVVKLMIKAHQK